MRCSYDEAKREKVLADRGLDLAEAWQVFEGFHLTRPDIAHSANEERVKTIGLLNEGVVLLVWSPHYDVESR
jgi:uncharacterized DUF497 family protein